MASKRELKKNINALTGELLNECFAFSYFHPEAKPKQVTEAMWALAHTRNELISRINRKPVREEQGKVAVRSFYRTLKTDVANMPDLMDHFAE
jgi:hypothetical protein